MNYGYKENYHKYRVQTECHDTRNYERDCRSESARPARRGRLRTFVGILLSVRRHRVPHPHGHGRRGAGRDVLDKTGRRFPLGRRSLRRTHGIPRHLAAMDRIDHLVPHRTDVRRRVDRLYRHERRARRGAGLEQGLHALQWCWQSTGSPRSSRCKGLGLGRQNQQMGRHDRHDHSRGSADPAGHHLHFDRRPQPHGHVAGILPRPLEIRQPRAGKQHLPLLCGYGDDGHSRDGRKEPVEELSQGNHHRLAGHGLHLRAGHLLAGLHHSRPRTSA